MLKKPRTEILTVVVFGLSLSWVLGCSRPEESGKKAADGSENVSPAPTATPAPTGPILLRFPRWLDGGMADELLKRARETSGGREIRRVEAGSKEWNLSLLPEDQLEDEANWPWIRENLLLYVNKVLLARAGVEKVPSTWEDLLQAVGHRTQLEGLTAFFALAGNSPGMFHTLTQFASLCGATSYSHPEEESVCVAVEAMGELYRRGDYIVDHEKGLGVKDPMRELARGKAVMTLAWESEALVLADESRASAGQQIEAASPPSFVIHGRSERFQPTRAWCWVVRSASGEDPIAREIAKNLSAWREGTPPFGKYGVPSENGAPSGDTRGFFRLDPPNAHAIRETRRILTEGWKTKKSGQEILQGIQLRYQAIREHKR